MSDENQGHNKMAADAKWRAEAREVAKNAMKAGDWKKAKSWWEASKCNDAAARGIRGNRA